MLASTYTPGWGYGYGHGFGQAQAPSILQLIAQAQERGRGFGHYSYSYGFGQPVSDFLTFNNGQSSPASFVGSSGAVPNLVFCNKDSANRPQCVLNKAPPANTAAPRAMQQAIDRIMNLIPANNLAGRQLQAEMPTGDGTKSVQTFTIPQVQQSPIATGGGGGLDGIVGDTTTKFGLFALTIGGMLKGIDHPGVELAFIEPARNDIWTEFSQEIANYLNDVADKFPELLQAFEARGNRPVQTQIDTSTIRTLVPLAAEKPKTGLIVGTAAAMIGLTAIAAVSAARHKPAMAYEDVYKPALGRGRKGRRSRGW